VITSRVESRFSGIIGEADDPVLAEAKTREATVGPVSEYRRCIAQTGRSGQHRERDLLRGCRDV
jgi:hypothetical protein